MLTSELVLSMEARAIVLHTLHWIASIVEVLGRDRREHVVRTADVSG